MKCLNLHKMSCFKASLMGWDGSSIQLFFARNSMKCEICIEKLYLQNSIPWGEVWVGQFPKTCFHVRNLVKFSVLHRSNLSQPSTTMGWECEESKCPPNFLARNGLKW